MHFHECLLVVNLVSNTDVVVVNIACNMQLVCRRGGLVEQVIGAVITEMWLLK